MSLAEVRIQHDRLAHSAGIVKGRSGFAIRIHVEHLEEVRQTLLPGSSPQPHLGPPSDIHLYKISPTPLIATRDDVVDFLAKNLTQCKSAIRRQLGPRAWLIALDQPMSSDYITLREGFILFSPWKQGRHYDSIRESVLVGDPKVLKQATQHITAAIVGTPTPMGGRTVAQGPRPPPQGPIQTAIQENSKTVEDKLLAIIEEQRAKSEERFASIESQMEASKNTTIQGLEEAGDRQTKHEISMQQALQKVENSSKTQSEAIETQMNTQFTRLFAELAKMQGGKEQKDTKRSPAPSPDAVEPNKSAKTS